MCRSISFRDRSSNCLNLSGSIETHTLSMSVASGSSLFLTHLTPGAQRRPSRSVCQMAMSWEQARNPLCRER